MKKIAVVVGLGLIGGSMAKALKQYSDYEVYGWNRTSAVSEQALAEGAIDDVADDEVFARCDLLIPVLYPRAAIQFLLDIIPKMKVGAQIVDLVGVKAAIIDAVEDTALKYGIRYTGGHPMAGLAKAGFERSFADLYQGANMILVPTKATADGDIEMLSGLFRQIGFGKIKVCDKETHDSMIAHTSQLAHVVSNSYVKSPVSVGYVGFTGGSYADMTRIACLNEKVWKELFVLNKDALVPEIDRLVKHMLELRHAIVSEDEVQLETYLRAGREAKELIDNVNANQKYSIKSTESFLKKYEE